MHLSVKPTLQTYKQARICLHRALSWAGNKERELLYLYYALEESTSYIVIFKNYPPTGSRERLPKKRPATTQSWVGFNQPDEHVQGLNRPRAQAVPPHLPL